MSNCYDLHRILDVKLCYIFGVTTRHLQTCCRVLERWSNARTKKNIERHTIYPAHQNYDQVTIEMNLQTLEGRRDELCIPFLKNTLEPNRKLYILLPKKLEYISTSRKTTRANIQRLYNISCKTEHFKHSSLVFLRAVARALIERQ